MPTFKGVFLPDALVISSTLSPDSKAVSIATQNLMVQLDAREPSDSGRPVAVGRTLDDSQLVAARLGNIFVQLQGDDPTVTVKVDIRGGVTTSAGGRAVLVTRLAGKTFTDELAEGEKSEDYFLTHTVCASPATGLAVTLLLLVDRDVVNGALPLASATVDSLDITFAEA